MNKNMTYAVVGCGSFGNEHTNALVNIKGAEITAFCDKHIEQCENLNKKYDLDAKMFTDYKVMLDEMKFDVVVVSTSDKEHAEIAIAAMKSGSHVMCEKPMSLFIEDCRKMIDTAKECDKVLMVGQVCRFAPGFIKAKDMIEKGVIGDLFFVESEYAHDYIKTGGVDNWRIDKDREPIIGGACHAIDLLRWLAGDPVETMALSNHKVLTNWPVDDTTVAIMKFPGDVIGKVFTSIGCKREYTMRTVLYGTKGTIVVDNTTPYLTLTLDECAPSGDFAEGYFKDDHDRNIKHLIPVEIDNHNVVGEHRAMRATLLEDEPLLMTGEEGAKTVAVCRAVVASAKSGEAVKVDYNF